MTNVETTDGVIVVADEVGTIARSGMCPCPNERPTAR